MFSKLNLGKAQKTQRFESQDKNFLILNLITYFKNSLRMFMIQSMCCIKNATSTYNTPLIEFIKQKKVISKIFETKGE